MFRKLAVALIAAVALVAAVGCRSDALAADAVVSLDLARHPASSKHLHWADCGDGFECATLAVPWDWTETRDKEKIQLALIQLSARAHRKIGSLLVNYGGPGASGLTSLRHSGELIRMAT